LATHRDVPVGPQGEISQSLGQGGGVRASDEQPVGAVTDDVAIARDVAGHHGRPRGEGLGEDHAEALPAERRGAEGVSPAQLQELGGVVGAPERPDAPRILEDLGDILRRGADQREGGGHLGAERLEGAQEDRQTLALDGLADEE